jgi:hypothetical protein
MTSMVSLARPETRRDDDSLQSFQSDGTLAFVRP